MPERGGLLEGLVGAARQSCAAVLSRRAGASASAADRLGWVPLRPGASLRDVRTCRALARGGSAEASFEPPAVARSPGGRGLEPPLTPPRVPVDRSSQPPRSPEWWNRRTRRTRQARSGPLKGSSLSSAIDGVSRRRTVLVALERVWKTGGLTRPPTPAPRSPVRPIFGTGSPAPPIGVGFRNRPVHGESTGARHSETISHGGTINACLR